MRMKRRLKNISPKMVSGIYESKEKTKGQP
jgi:hypothetical protein